MQSVYNFYNAFSMTDKFVLTEWLKKLRKYEYIRELEHFDNFRHMVISFL